MSVTTLPQLHGSLATVSYWQTFFAKSGNRVYPYSLGCMVRTTGAATPVLTHGVGQFANNDYFMACSVNAYGQFIPDTSRVAQATTVDADDLVYSPNLSLVAGEYLLNLEVDTGGLVPVYDGSVVSLKTDPIGTAVNANKYLTTALNGLFRAWTQTGLVLVDLLVTDSSGVPLIVLPQWPLGAEIA